jgi:heat shock protein HspQ
MFDYVADEEACTAIALLSGTASDADYASALSFLERTDRTAAERGVALIHILVMAPGYPQPSPKWRQRLSELIRDMRAQPYYFVLITDSALARGVLTALRWLVGTRAGHHTHAAGTFEQAAAWIRRASGEPHPQLEPLYAQLWPQMPPGSTPR